jgi:stage IV sporulation protein FB
LPESLLTRRLKLGNYLGIGLYVHWSFALLILFVAISSRGNGLAMVAFSVSQLLGLFLCVTLHEYGHAIAARAFGIATADITLLPIGGVARLQRMPRIPWQELVVAVAGPAVNVIIAGGLLISFFLFVDHSLLSTLWSFLLLSMSELPVDEEMVKTVYAVFETPSLLHFGLAMLAFNIVLVIFNMIPAFPMDGGRVFRSVIAMVMDYRRATWIASRVGVACAVLMAAGALALNPANPIPVVIAVFIGYAGLSEARHVDVMESVRGLIVRDVMIQTHLALPMDTPLAEIVRYWRGVSASAIPVVSMVGTAIGILSLRDVAAAINRGADPSTTAGQLIDHESAVGTVRAEQSLESALMRWGKQGRQIPVVDEVGMLIGVLDLDTMLVRRSLSTARSENAVEEAEPRFDLIT